MPQKQVSYFKSSGNKPINKIQSSKQNQSKS